MPLQLAWQGETHRPLQYVHAPCDCRTCSDARPDEGLGYLSMSDDQGRGVTVWITDPDVHERLTDFQMGDLI